MTRVDDNPKNEYILYNISGPANIKIFEGTNFIRGQKNKN